jgi:hypothetical protein
VTRDEDQLRHTVYRKKTHSDRYLNAKSHHHPQQKRALMKTLFHRAETICDEDSKERELKHIKSLLNAMVSRTETFDLQEKLDNTPNNKLTRNLLASHMYKE